MNQILITQKLYVTPELKRKKKIYRLEFFISVFLVCLLFSYYIYAEYDKTKSEEVSKDILAAMDTNEEESDEEEEDTTQASKDENGVLVIVLNENGEEESEEASEEEQEPEPEIEEKVHRTKNGTKYYTRGRVYIPKIGVDYPIIEGEIEAIDELLKLSPCKFWGPRINEVGNYCIVGHNYRNKRFFSKVPSLVNGDIIEITDLTGRTIKYVVYNKYQVSPDETECTSQHTNGKKEITLITCTNDSKERIIVKATEVL